MSTPDPTPSITGADALVAALVAGGVGQVFANPGTSELAFVAALQRRRQELSSFIVLDETVASGAADGAGRMSDRIAATLLHLGPGLGNALANCHNAAKAYTPMLNIVGDHASDHRHRPSPLQSDIAAIATPVSVWVGVTECADDVGARTTEALGAARDRCGPATLVVPSDHASDPTTGPAGAVGTRPAIADGDDSGVLEAALGAIERGGCAVLLGGAALRADGLALASRLAETTGVDLWAPIFPARVERTRPQRVPLRRLPYFPTQAAEALAGYDTVVLIGADAPVAIFAYPDEPRDLITSAEVIALAGPRDDALAALAALVERCRADAESSMAALDRPDAPSGSRLDAFVLARALAATAPDDCIVVDEAQTNSIGLWDGLLSVPHDLLTLTGGAIGSGPALAVGAATAAPGRRIINIEGDGSAMYCLAAWWTQARFGLDITTVICSNGSYAILDLELMRAGMAELAGGVLTDLGGPAIDMVAIATGLGVPAERITTADALVGALRRSFATPGPFLIDMRLDHQ